MTEKQWLECEDPQAMIHQVLTPGTLNPARTSDRKLRLFCCACERATGSRLVDSPSWLDDWESDDPQRIGYGGQECIAADSWASHLSPEMRSQRAAILRDIIGNPFRPVKISRNGKTVEQVKQEQASPYGCCERHADNMGCDCLALAGEVVTWLTPTVLAIAQQAYDERPGRVCEKCNGRAGSDWYPPDDPTNSRLEGPVWSKCIACKGTGRIEDGQLDPTILSVLADALIDAGMPETVECVLDEEKGKRLVAAGRRVLCNKGCCFECEDCSKKPGSPVLCKLCLELRTLCNSTLNLVAHPILAALRSPGPKYRGLWCLDVILGKE